jgi:hypothetical protein
MKEIITRKLLELDREHAEYQRLHRKFHGEYDNVVRSIYRLLADSYESILKEIEHKERKK